MSRWRKGRIAPVSTAVGGYIESQFQATPHTEFVKRIAQVILYYLLGGADDRGYFAIGLAFPNQYGDLNLLGS